MSGLPSGQDAESAFTQSAIDELLAQIDNQGPEDPTTAWQFCQDFDYWITQASADGLVSEEELDRYRGQIWFMLGRLYYIDGDVSAATDHFLRASEASGRAGLVKRQVYCLKDLAIAYEFTGLQDESTQRIFEALDLARELGDQRTLGLALYGLASLYSAQDSHQQTIEICQQVLAIAEDIGDVFLECYARGGIGSSLGHLDKVDEGIAWIEQSVAASAKDGLTRFEAYGNGTLVSLYRKAGRIDDALAAADRWLGSVSDIPAQNAAGTYVNLAEMYLELGDIQQAWDMLKNADDVVSSGQLTGHLLRYHQVAARIHESQGDLEQALESTRTYAKVLGELGGTEARARLIATERYYTEELVRKNEQLSALNQKKEEILQVVAHDLQNPIAAVSYLSDVLLTDEGAQRGSSGMSQLESIRRVAAEMQETVDALLEAESESDAERSAVDVRAVVSQVIQQQQSQADNKQITIEHDLGEAQILSDAGLLRRAVDNLLSNSLKYSLEDTTITVMVQNVKDQVRIVVADQGVGLTKLELEHAFDKFARPGPRPTVGERSTGLGLYIAKQLVDRMGGTISLSSPGPGQGARAVIEFPRAY